MRDHVHNRESVARKEKLLITSKTAYFDGLALMNSMGPDRVDDGARWTRWFRDFADPFTLSEFEASINFLSMLNNARLCVATPEGFDPASALRLLDL